MTGRTAPSAGARTPGPGRPRHVAEPAGATGSAREQILEAAAALFVEQGFAATSTRAIAERVGIRQASLYYHFAGKDDLLEELLDASVRPTLEVAAELGSASSPQEAAAALEALVRADVHTLTSTPHNIGTLYLLPEVQQPRYEAFREAREELRRTYARLGAAIAGDDADSPAGRRRGEMLLQLVEVVIHQRRERTVTDDDARALAEACLRLCGVPAD